MSVQTDVMPPAPVNIKPIIKEGGNKDRFDTAWQRWFLQVKYKLDTLNATLVNVSQVVGSGLATLNEDGTWTTTSIVGVGSGGTGLNEVTSGNFLRGAGTSPLEERTPSQVRGDIGAAPEMTATSTSATGGTATALPSQPVGYVEIQVGGATKKIAYYD